MSMIPAPDVAHALHERIVDLKTELSRNALSFGQALTEMQETRGYTTLGFSTFELYLTSADVEVARRTAYTFMNVAQKFGHVQHAAHLDYTKLDILARLITPGDDPETVVALVEQARETPRAELRDAVRAEAERKRETPAEDYVLPVTLVAPTAENPGPMLAQGLEPEPEEPPFTYPARDEAEWHTSGDEAPAYDAIPRVNPDTLRHFPARPSLVPAPTPTPEPETGAYSRYALLEQYNGAIGRVLTAARYAKDLYRHTPSDDMAEHLTDQEESDDDAIILDFTAWVRAVILARQSGVKVRRVK
jgi:hypothetical protein